MGEFRKQNIGIAAISADTREDSAAFIEEEGITVPLLADPGLTAINAYGVAMEGKDIAVPATFVVGQDKTIRWSYVGENMTDRPDEHEVLAIAQKAKGN
jgi:peroxiredoxin